MYETKHLRILERDGWEYVERKRAREAVAVIAVTDAGELVLTEQYRRAVDARVIDLPAGLVEEHPPAETAKRELEEETGFTCEEVEFLARGPTSPGLTSELVSFYRARGVRRVGPGGGIGDEEITVHLVPLRDIDRWLRSRGGVLIDVKVWAGLRLM
ncbi:MAG TPA: NUDIX hydrolase [Thermoanaerobaculia bacterium]|nr:NUDIX hydrolase [Thermoanaerobaculia bacterium]